MFNQFSAAMYMGPKELFEPQKSLSYVIFTLIQAKVLEILWADFANKWLFCHLQLKNQGLDQKVLEI